jgi:uncharacterized protein (DUF169 family)
MLDTIKEYFGTRKCSGMLANCPMEEVINIPSKKMRFCEAVNHSFEIPLLINKQNIGCMGAARNLGFQRQTDDEISSHISENTGIARDFVKKMLACTAPVNRSLKNIYMGITEAMEEVYPPDFFIVYAKPVKVMQLIHELARKQQKRPFISSYSLLSICGHVFVSGYLTGAICISFGCPESRKYGGVSEDEMVIGFPGKLTHSLFA